MESGNTDRGASTVPSWRRAVGAAPAALAVSIASALLAATSALAKGEAAGEASSSKPAMRFFVSGHSLNDDPFAGYLAAIATSKGYDADWNEQIVIGSPISYRVRGDGGGWGGYSRGKNRGGGEGRNVIEEFKDKAKTAPYTALILAEGHNTLAVARYHDPARYVRHFHDRLVETNPDATTYFYQPWESIADVSDPAPWMALERDAVKVWSCVVERVNMSLVHEGRKDRVVHLPIGLGVVELVDAAVNRKLPGNYGDGARAALKAVMTDDVHLQPLGIYYVALLTFIGMTGEKPDGAWAPQQLTAEQAKFLQEFAWDFYQGWKPDTMTMPECRQFISQSFCKPYNAYVPNKWSPVINECETYFSNDKQVFKDDDQPNPFVFDPDTESRYWFPSP